MEDLGLQAILEKMNSLINPLISGTFWKISKIFRKCLMISQSSLQHKIQYKLNLGHSSINYLIGVARDADEFVTDAEVLVSPLAFLPSKAGIG